MKRRLLQTLITCVVMSSLIVVPVCASPTEDKETLEAKKSEAEAQAASVNEELVSLLVDFNALKQDMATQEDRIAQAETDLAKAKEEEEKQYEDMKLRIKYMYEQGDATFFETMVDSSSYADLVNKAEYVKNVHDYDRDKLNEYVETKNEVQTLKTELESGQAEMESMASEMEMQKSNLEGTLTEMKSQIADFDAQLAQAEEEAQVQLEELTEESDTSANVTDTSSDNNSQSSDNQSTSSKPSDNQGGNQNNGNQGGNGNSGNNGGNNSTSKPSNESKPSKPSNESKPSEKEDKEESSESKPSNASLGQKIANKGLKYVGNKYVYGGNSLTNGIDCSGFVQQIHKKFGISTPRSSSSIRKGGKSVSVSNMLPGDVVCYSGHVAIYIGNNKIVHASNSSPYPKGGIKISSPADYRTILAVRRYW
ncbi:putative uncharacterized protein [Dorea sp. CAG:317]|nr:putative uncharacterized protein [Dorea sp. CAG:317]